MNASMAFPGVVEDFRLLRLCAVPFFNNGREAEIRRMLPGIRDWNRLIDLSISHSVLPLLHEHLQKAGCAGEIPSAAQDRLRNLHYKCAVRNTALLAELVRVINLFDSAGLQAVPVKGPLLAISCYGDLNRRRFDDLDLLVAASEIPKARGILMQSGYRNYVDLPPTQLQAFIKAGWDINLRQGEDEYSIDISTGITPGFFCFRVPDPVISDNLSAFEYQDRTFPSFAPELLLILLAAHGSYHRWKRLIWIADIRAVIETYRTMDINRLVKLARQLGAVRMLQLALMMADRLEPLPAEFSRLIPDTSVLRKLADNPSGRIHYHLAARERWRDKLCYLFRYFLAPTFSDWKVVPLPRFMNWFYYVIRPFRVVLGKKIPARQRGS